MLSTLPDGGRRLGPPAAMQSVKRTFPDSPPTAVLQCVSEPAVVGNPVTGTGRTNGNWTPEQIRRNLDSCDGGTGVWSAAKAANGGRDPVITSGTTQTGGFVDLAKGNIVLDSQLDACTATQIQIQELTNLSHKQDFLRTMSNANNGDLGRESYVRAIEQYEYDGVKNVIDAFDKCKDNWKCKTCEKEWARKYKNFDDYYKVVSKDHKEFYGQNWDRAYKKAYEAKHINPPTESTPWWQFW